MKMKELVKAFEQYRDDSDAQLKQLRGEVQQLQRELLVKSTKLLTAKQHSTKADDIEFGKKVMEALHKNEEHPYVKDRDVFTTWHMHLIITSTLDDSTTGLTNDVDSMLMSSSEPKVRNELRMMCNRLVNSGLFITRKAQRYIPSMPEYGQKPSRRRRTAIVARNFDKYNSMSESQMEKELSSQEVLARNRNAEVHTQVESTELDTEVSFL